MSETAVETPEVEAEAVEEKPKREKKVVVATPCACQFYTGKDKSGNDLSTGCNGENVRTFLPGHDAKLKSLLIQVGVAGGQVTKATDDEDVLMDPLHAAEEYGFRSLVEQSIDKAKVKEEARAAKAQERADAKAKKEQEKAAAKAKREQAAKAKKAHAEAVAKAAEDAKGKPGPAKAKVGRTTVDGEILADGTFKYKKGDEDVETTNYTVVIDPASVPVPDVEA
jgi:hypothetical protein